MTPGRHAPVFLLTGGSGQVGRELRRGLAPLGRVVAPESSALDLADEASIRAAVRHFRPEVIVNAGAYTAVDRAETDVARCMAVNATAPGILAEEALKAGAALVHYSTDYVFDGQASRPYVEEDATGPLNAYGVSKLAGERAIHAVGGGWIVLRTSWVYGTHGGNFLRTMLRLAREREELMVVDDQVGAPTWSRSIASATAAVLGSVLATGRPPADAVAGQSGVYHLTSSGRTTWREFAEAILAGDPRRGEHRCRRIVPIQTSEYRTAARRPLFSLLDNTRIRERFGVTLADWREQLGMVLRELPS